MKKTKINKDFIEKGAGDIHEKDMDKAIRKRKEIEDKITESGTLKKYWQISRYMFIMLNDYRRGAYRDAPWLTISALIFSLLYVLNPLDLIPDFIPVIGYLDDVTVFALGLNFVQKDLRKYLRWKYDDAFDDRILDPNQDE